MLPKRLRLVGALSHSSFGVVAALALGAWHPAQGSDNLRATFENLRPRLASSSFGRPLLIESSDESGMVRGDVFALVQYPFRQVSMSLNTPVEWCEVLILHLNVKTCSASLTTNQKLLQLTLGTKRANGDKGAQRIEFRFRVVESSAAHFQVTMQASEGPLDTRDYQLSLEATPIASDQSFLHLAYAYKYSTTARLAMNTYLQTLGKSKVGFTLAEDETNGVPVYIGGVRGALERNTMRYYLGIEVFLASGARPAAERREWRLASWYDATEKYPRQLHELTKAEYLAGKRFTDPVSEWGSVDTL